MRQRTHYLAERVSSRESAAAAAAARLEAHNALRTNLRKPVKQNYRLKRSTWIIGAQNKLLIFAQ